MQDKIQEIMGLVESLAQSSVKWGHASAFINEDGCKEHRDLAIATHKAIESKLRELVREPLSDDAIKMIDDSTHFHESTDWPIRFARAIERAHNITNTSGVE